MALQDRKKLRKAARSAKKRQPLRNPAKVAAQEEAAAAASAAREAEAMTEFERQNRGSKGKKEKEKKRKAQHLDGAPCQLDPHAQAEIDADEREIARLGKLLGLKDKKGTQKLNKEFEMFEGFGGGFADFLDDLDTIGTRTPSNGKKAVAHLDSDSDSGAEGNDGHLVDDSEQEESDVDDEPVTDYSGEEEEEEEEEDSDGGGGSGSDSDSDSDDEGRSSKEKKGQGLSTAKHAYRPVQGEDIYGRRADEAAPSATQAYVPPSRRAKQAAAALDADSVAAEAPVRRQVTGLLNRLSEQTRDSVVRGLKGVFDSNSTSIASNVLKDCVMGLCNNPAQTMQSLMPLYAALVAALHFTVGVDVGAHLVEHLTVTMHAALQEQQEGGAGSKVPHNCLSFLLYLYSYRVVSSQLVVDVMQLLVGREGAEVPEYQAELLLLLFRQCGSQLRADEPVPLRGAHNLLTTKARSQADADAEGSRLTFLLDALTDLKNNKSRRSGNDAEEACKSLRRWIGTVKSALGSSKSVGGAEAMLRVSLDDLLEADNRGRWWRAGASWAGKKGEEAQPEQAAEKRQVSAEEKALLKLAKKMRFHTSTRQNIFVVTMSSRDVNDAFERLTSLALKGKQDREIVRVLIECCAQEQTFNAFYAELASLLCAHNRQFRTTFQFAFWDAFKSFEDGDCSDLRATNLAQMMAVLVSGFHLSLSVIKPIDMAALGDTSVMFLATFFLALFASAGLSDDTFSSILDRVAATKDFAEVREAVLVFLQLHLTAAPAHMAQAEAQRVESRRKLAITTMMKMAVLDYRGDDSNPQYEPVD